MPTQSLTVTAPAGATSVVVTGAFGTGYQAVVTPAWNATVVVSAKTPSQFTVTFGTPAPPGGSTFDAVVETAGAPVSPSITCVQAGTLMTRMRAKIPDSVFINDVPQPEMDGKFRAQTIYGWFDDAVQVLTQLTGWTMTDWWAMPQVEFQPFYDVDVRWVSMESAFSNQWPVDVIQMEESDTIWPQTSGQLSQQSLTAYVRRLGTNLQVGLWPTPNLDDPQANLVGAISDSSTAPITLTTTANFLSFGYVQIDNEILAYQFVTTPSPTGIAVISRGIGGTTPAAHADNAVVQHLGFWIKGRRLPGPIVNSLSCVEVPRGWISHLETYVLGQCRMEQKRFAEGDKLLANFEKACRNIDADPNWKVNRGLIPAYGSPRVGPIYFPGGGGVVVP